MREHSIGEVHQALASVSNADAEDIKHHVVIMVTKGGDIRTLFCCDSRDDAAALAIKGASLLIAGEPSEAVGPVSDRGGWK